MQNGLSSVRFWSKALQRPILVKSFTAQVEGAVHLAYCVQRIFGCWVWIIMHYTYRLILPAGAFTPLTTLGPIYNIYTRRFYPSTSYSGFAWAAR